MTTTKKESFRHNEKTPRNKLGSIFSRALNTSHRCCTSITNDSSLPRLVVREKAASSNIFPSELLPRVCRDIRTAFEQTSHLPQRVALPEPPVGRARHKTALEKPPYLLVSVAAAVATAATIVIPALPGSRPFPPRARRRGLRATAAVAAVGGCRRRRRCRARRSFRLQKKERSGTKDDRWCSRRNS